MTTADTAPAPPITEARLASPWVVALPNQKGGVGKTTLALALAAVTADANGRALVVDVDPQSSSAEMAGRMADPGFDFSHEMNPGTLARLRELRNYDMAVHRLPGLAGGGADPRRGPGRRRLRGDPVHSSSGGGEADGPHGPVRRRARRAVQGDPEQC